MKDLIKKASTQTSVTNPHDQEYVPYFGYKTEDMFDKVLSTLTNDIPDH